MAGGLKCHPERGEGSRPQSASIREADEIPRTLGLTRLGRARLRNVSPCGRIGADSKARRLRLIGVGALAVLVLGGCASSPEAARVRGEPGADPGNHGNPVVLLEPPNAPERIYYEIPYDGPRAAVPDTAQS